MDKLNEADLSNLITACSTSRMREGSPAWAAELDRLATILRDARAKLDQKENRQ
jgi:hypothetical protein